MAKEKLIREITTPLSKRQKEAAPKTIDFKMVKDKVMAVKDGSGKWLLYSAR